MFDVRRAAVPSVLHGGIRTAVEPFAKGLVSAERAPVELRIQTIHFLVTSGRVMASKSICMALCHRTPLPAISISGPSCPRPAVHAARRTVASFAASASIEKRPTSGIALYNEDVEVYDRVFSDRYFEQEVNALAHMQVHLLVGAHSTR